MGKFWDFEMKILLHRFKNRCLKLYSLLENAKNFRLRRAVNQENLKFEFHDNNIMIVAVATGLNNIIMIHDCMTVHNSTKSQPALLSKLN